MDHLPVPQTYPPIVAPEIDPATLCFESPISLSSNDTSINSSAPDHNQNKSVTQTQQGNCNTMLDNMSGHVNAMADNINSNDYRQDYSEQVYNNNSIVNNTNPQQNGQQHHLQQQTNTNNYMDNQGTLNYSEGQNSDYYVDGNNQLSDQSPAYMHQQPMSHQSYTQMNTSDHHLSDQVTSPQSVTCDYQNMLPSSQSSQNVMMHSQSGTVCGPHNMPPPQSPHVMIPKSPLFQPNSPLLAPQSPHVTPQSPLYQHNSQMLSPGQQSQQYPYRNRTGSVSGLTAPPSELTPPPGTPSPTKHTPPDRYQYFPQMQIPPKNPNVAVNGRGMYNTGIVPGPGHHQGVFGMGSYPQQAFTNQHLLTNQYMDPRYLNSHYHQMQQLTAQANQSSMYGQVQPNNMYSYYP